MADDQTFVDDIEGYCTPLSARAGETVSVRVSTRAERFDLRVERWGVTRETVLLETALPGTFVPPPPDADAAGCRWPISLAIPVDPGWRSGFYLVTLMAHGAPSGRDVAYACFVVRSAAGTEAPSRALFVLDTNTWNAYNTWGGRSLYTGGSTVSFDRPFARGMLCRPAVDRDDRKARPTRWGEEPDADGLIFQAYRTSHEYPSAIGSAGWYTHGRRFVEWAEQAGYEFDMAISTDLDLAPGALAGYDLVISAGHDEYWSAGQRDAVESHVRGGGHFVSFSGNTMFWQVRIEHGAPAVDADPNANTDPALATGPATDDPAVNMVCHKYSAHLDDPVVTAGSPELMTGMWCDPLVGRPEWRFLGAGSAFGLYHRFGTATARGVGGFIVYRPDHWLMAGTGLRYGDVLGNAHGVVGYETVGCPIAIDEFQLPVAAPLADLPAAIEIVGHVPSSNLGVGEYPKSIAALDDQGDLEFLATRLYGDTSAESLARVRHGNAVMLVCRPFGSDGGEVVTVGTTDWVFGLADDLVVARVTANALDRYVA